MSMVGEFVVGDLRGGEVGMEDIGVWVVGFEELKENLNQRLKFRGGNRSVFKSGCGAGCWLLDVGN